MPGRDARLIYAAAFLRATAVGAMGIVLAIYLTGAGLTITATGLVIAAGLAGATALTLLVAFLADRWGRRRTFVALAALSALGCLAPLADTLAITVPLAFIGMTNGMGRDRGPAGALEQAVLPDTVEPERRTWVLAWYNLVLDSAHALGALGGTIPVLLMVRLALTSTAAHRITLACCAAMMAASAVPYMLLSAGVERHDRSRRRNDIPVDPGTRRTVARLCALFGLDSLAGGFLGSALIAYWFFREYHLSEAAVAGLFVAARMLNAASHVAAAWLAHRIGLLNTMVWTHLPSSVLLMAAPATPSAVLAGALFLGREALVEMDVPTRQSYVMAVVPREHRTYASGLTNVTRTAGWALGPAVAGWSMQHLALAAPLFVGGSLKILYDLVLYRSFRRVKPPEETAGH
jgi:MFS family permease